MFILPKKDKIKVVLNFKITTLLLFLNIMLFQMCALAYKFRRFVEDISVNNEVKDPQFFC